MFAAKYAVESGTITLIPIKDLKFFGVSVCWPGKKAEHSFFLDLFCYFFVSRQKSKELLFLHLNKRNQNSGQQYQVSKRSCN